MFTSHLTPKLAEDDPRRAALAAADSTWRTRVEPAVRGEFRHRGAALAANSLEHGVLYARATGAEVLARPHVRQALSAGERTWPAIRSEGALGRYVPFARMVMRAPLTRR